MRYRMIVGVPAALLSLAVSPRSIVASPTAEIQSTVEQVIKLLADPKWEGEGQKVERRKLLREAISVRFDFKEMAKRSLGSNWRRLTPGQQDEFVSLFTRLLEKVYLDRIESYHNEKFVYTDEKKDEPYAVVNSKIVTSGGEEYTLDYRLHRVRDEWRIYDVVIEGVSVVNNYRAQFDRVIYQESYEELVRRIKQKLSQSRD